MSYACTTCNETSTDMPAPKQFQQLMITMYPNVCSQSCQQHLQFATMLNPTECILIAIRNEDFQQARRKINNWGGIYSYILVHRL